MAAIVLHSSFILVTFTVLLAFSTTTYTLATITKPRQQVVMKLIHRYSRFSPYYNSNVPVSYSIGYSNNPPFSYHVSDIETTLVRSTYADLLFVNFFIGQPPIPQLAIMDTGSSLVWIHSVPCKHCSEDKIRYDPSKSSTYAELSCNHPYCYHTPSTSCKLETDQCIYYQNYTKGPSSIGLLAREQVILETSNEGLITLPNMVFGCAHRQNSMFVDKRHAGVFGLAYRITSIVHKLGDQGSKKFSYCIGNLTDPDYGYNTLTLGDGAEVEGDSTPLDVYGGHYHVSLDGISLGEKRLEIDPNTFELNRTAIMVKTGVTIDTGTPYTWLAPAAFHELYNKVKEKLDEFLNQWSEPGRLCYEGNVINDLTGFPVVTFYFAGGAELAMDTESMFIQSEPKAFCMTVLENKENNQSKFTIIGLLAQQYYNVAYDINSRKLSLQRIDCELIV